MRALVEDYYDIQRLRIDVQGRLRAYHDGVSEQEIVFIKESVLGTLLKIENDVSNYILRQVKNENVWVEWLKGVKGIGHILAGGLISLIGDTSQFATISKLWRYAGLAVAEDGKAERRKRGEKIRYNPHLKVLCWKIGESIVKSKGGYRELYEEFRKEYNEKWITPDDCKSEGCRKQGNGKCMDGHKYMAAKRKTVKVFLAHYWQLCRTLKGEVPGAVFIIGRGRHEHEIPIIDQ